jgi:hypothetical protein
MNGANEFVPHQVELGFGLVTEANDGRSCGAYRTLPGRPTCWRLFPEVKQERDSLRANKFLGAAPPSELPSRPSWPCKTGCRGSHRQLIAVDLNCPRGPVK